MFLVLLFVIAGGALFAAPTPLIVDMHEQSIAVLDSLLALQAQATLANTPEEMIVVIENLASPLSQMVRMDIHVDNQSSQEGNPDDSELWKSLLSNMRQIGITLESINAELMRFSDNEDVTQAYAKLEEHLSQAYIDEVNQ